MGLRRLSVGGGWEAPHLALSSFSGAVERNEPRGEPLEAINRSAGENDRLPAFFEKLSQLGDVEGQNLTIERYSGKGRPEDFADLTRRVVDSNPDLIVAITNQVALAARTATGTIPIVWTGVEPVRAGLARSLAHPGGNITGITIDTGNEIWGKRLQILKEVVPRQPKSHFWACGSCGKAP